MAKIDVGLAERVAEFVVFALAEGGFDPDGEKAKDPEYRLRKETEGRRIWDEMNQNQQAHRRKMALIRCECASPKKRGGYKGERGCFMCDGAGWRTLDHKEQSHLDWQQSQWQEDYHRQHNSEGCVAEYVIESSLAQFEYGYWSPPRETDGWIVQNWAKKPPAETIEVETQVKVFKGPDYLGTVVKRIRVSKPPGELCSQQWLPLKQALIQRKKALRGALKRTVDAFLLRELKRDVWMADKILGNLNRWGSAPYSRDLVQEVLDREQWAQISYLYPHKTLDQHAEAA